MSIRCSFCGREYDVTLFEFGRSITCPCGSIVTLRHEQLKNKRISDLKLEESNIREIMKKADRISFLIVGSDYPMIDIEIEKQKLRDLITELFPDKVDLYDLIYESRFRRLEEQFRGYKKE